jgi:hypothetical protein
MEFFQARSLSNSICGGPKVMPRWADSRASHNHFGGVQQRLGGDAAAIEANAAQLFVLLDQQNFFAQGRRRKKRRRNRPARRPAQQFQYESDPR